jgi:putative transposase
LIDGSIVDRSVAGGDASRAEAAWLGTAPGDIRSLYQRLLPFDFLDQLRQNGSVRENNRIYTVLVVMWLMIAQRLQGNATLQWGVLELLCGLPASFWPSPCKRLQVGAQGERPRLSSNTGSYNNARQQLPVSIVEQAFDRVFQQLIAETDSPGAPPGPVFFLDGTSLRMPNTPELRKLYQPGSNQNGASHWPLLRMIVAHDLYTGLAMRPEWGAMNGDEAVSEQGLLERAVERLPAGAALLGDANFGVFSVAYAADRRSHRVILRLTTARAQHLLGGPLQDGIDRRIQWKPTRDDRRNHSELPENACVCGRVIVLSVQPSNGSAPFLLALFTTLETPAEQIVPLYGKRWDIETDLRSLKSTLQLEQLSCTSPEMVAKEIDLAMLAYNLVRAVTYLAARKTGGLPRSFSFTRVRQVINAFAPRIAAAQDEQEARKLWDDMMYYVGQAKLPQRKRPRPCYPRAVWPQPYKYPKRKE